MLRSLLRRSRKEESQVLLPSSPRSCPCMKSCNPGTLTHLPLYSYEPLPTPRSTRLFQLEQGPPHQPIRGSLKVVNIDDCLPYFALSYTWGSTNTPHAVECDSCRIYITCNLYSVLNRLRGLAEGPSLWFIDALSIDQDVSDRAFSERGSQVRLMENIFGNAQMVWASLGEEIEKGAIQIVQTLCTINDAKWADMVAKSKRFQKLSLPVWDDESWVAYGSIFERSWFNRIWIVQEYALAKDVVFIAGDELIPAKGLWSSLKRANTMINLHHPRKSRFGGGDKPALLTSTLERALQRFQAMTYFSSGDMTVSRTIRPSSLSQALARTIEHEATDLRDRIYALYGVIKDTDLSNFAVDYGEDIAELSLRLSLFLARQEDPRELVQLLHVLACRESVAGLSTWMIDLQSHHPYTGFDRNIDYMQMLKWYKAGNGAMVSCRVDEHDTRKLILRGVLLDSITYISPAYPLRQGREGREDVRKKVAEILDWDRCTRSAMLESNASTPQGLMLWNRAYRRTTTAGGMAYLRHTSLTDAEIDAYDRFVASFGPSTSSSQEQMDIIVEKISLLINTFCFNACVATTSQHRMCLVPNTAVAGDCVAIFNGFPTPFLIRPVDGGHNLLGGTYVHGFMDGEVYRLTDSKQVDIGLL